MSTVVLRLLLLVSLAALPELVPHSVAQTRRAPAKAAGPLTIRGCISGGREAYTLMQSSTGTSFALQGDNKLLQPLRGHLVELTGRESPPTSSTGLKELPILAVKSVRIIATQCPFRTEGTVALPKGVPGTVPPAQNTTKQTTAPAAATPRYQPPGAPNQTPPIVGNNPNVGGATGKPSPGTGNPPKQPPPPR